MGVVWFSGVLATAMSRAMKCFLHDFYDKIPTENLWISTFSVWVVSFRGLSHWFHPEMSAKHQ